MIKKLAAVILCVWIGTACIACQTNNPLHTNEPISFQEDVFGGVFMTEINQIWGVFRSQEEVKTFFDNYDIIWDNLPVWERYSNDFYKEKALIFYSGWQSDQSIKRYIDNAYIDKNMLTLYIVGEVPESKVQDGKIEVNTDAIFLTFIIEVDQTDNIDTDKVTAEFRYEIIK